MDGAREETHDRLRGKGSYRRVMRAASICVVKELPFTLNMVLTAQNRNEIGEMVVLAEQLGSGWSAVWTPDADSGDGVAQAGSIAERAARDRI